MITQSKKYARWLVPVALALGSPSHADDSGDWLQLATETLSAHLKEVRADVTEWSVVPLPLRGHVDWDDGGMEPKVQIVRIGARSAVRLIWPHNIGSRARTAWFTVKCEQVVMTTRRPISVGETLTPGDVEWSQREVFASGCTPLVGSAEVLNGKRAKHALRAGDALCEHTIEARPPVARGDEVVVRSSAGRVTIIAKGIAEQDGMLGQRLRVRNTTNRQTFLASVSGEREVSVR